MNDKERDMLEEMLLELNGYINAAYLITEASRDHLSDCEELIRKTAGLANATGKLFEYADSVYFLLGSISESSDRIYKQLIEKKPEDTNERQNA